MEQYELDPRFRSLDVRRIFRRFRPTWIFIRRVGSQGGGTIVNAALCRKTLRVESGINKLSIFIDGVKRFEFLQSHPQDKFQWGRRFSIAYERESFVYARTGFENPYESALPEIERSILRSVNRGYLLEVTFDDTIPVEKTQPWHPPIFYWRVRRRVKRS